MPRFTPPARRDAPKKQALETLIKHIDAILPKLASIEQTGSLAALHAAQRPVARPAAPMPRQPVPQAAVPQAAVNPAPIPETIEKPEMIIAETAAPVTQPAPPTLPTAESVPETRAAPALWEAVRGFIQTQRNAIMPPAHQDEQAVAEYTEMIEADMMHHQYSSTVENLDISPQKKQG